MNKAGQDVVVKSSDNNPAEGWKVKKGFMMDITKGTTSAQPVTLAATSTDGKTPLAMNGTTEMQITPHATKGNTKDVVVLGTQRELDGVLCLRSTVYSLRGADIFSLCKLASTSYDLHPFSILHVKLGTFHLKVVETPRENSLFSGVIAAHYTRL